jgi:chemotaxis protein methyltransferase CheR
MQGRLSQPPAQQGGWRMDQLSKADFDRLVDFMYKRYGQTLGKKKVLVEGRLQSVAKEKGFPSVSAYVQHALNDKSGTETGILLTRLTTNYTYFWRETVHYQFLTDIALPELTSVIKNKDLAVWSAGCSSGQEPYMLAMTIDQYFKHNKAGWDTTVLATDISPAVLQQAIDAVYSVKTMENMPQEYIKKYFTKISEEEYKITDALRREVVFRPFNLMETHIPFKKKFHIIFCRNVMIYMDHPTRNALMQRYYDALVPGGYFITSLSESVDRNAVNFDMIKGSIYRKPLKG